MDCESSCVLLWASIHCWLERLYNLSTNYIHVYLQEFFVVFSCPVLIVPVVTHVEKLNIYKSHKLSCSINM